MINIYKFDKFRKFSCTNLQGEKYDINTLPDKVKDLLKAAKVADNQIKIQEDNLKLITIARQTIAAQLQKS